MRAGAEVRSPLLVDCRDADFRQVDTAAVASLGPYLLAVLRKVFQVERYLDRRGP